jgi:hypothetical protein
LEQRASGHQQRGRGRAHAPHARTIARTYVVQRALAGASHRRTRCAGGNYSDTRDTDAVSVSCSAGKKVIGGGCFTNTTVQANIYVSYPWCSGPDHADWRRVAITEPPARRHQRRRVVERGRGAPCIASGSATAPGGLGFLQLFSKLDRGEGDGDCAARGIRHGAQSQRSTVPRCGAGGGLRSQSCS